MPMATIRLRVALTALALSAAPAFAGPLHSVGQVIRLVSTYYPTGSVEANGQSLTIADNADLFSVIGTLYGADDANSFKVPALKPIYGSGGGRIVQCIVTIANPSP
jgi:microcystin-dependent protein